LTGQMNRINKIKYLIFAIIILLIILIVVLGIVFYFSRKNQPRPSYKPQTTSFLQGTISQIEAFPLKILHPNFSDGKIIYQGYYQGDLLQGEVSTGKISVLIEKTDLPDLDGFVVSPAATKILLHGKDKNNTLRFFLLELESKSITPLNPSFKTAIFASEEKIVYHYLDKAKGVSNLSIADPDGKNWKKIIDLKEENVFLSTLPTGEIAYTASETTDNFSVIKTDGSGKRTIKLPVLINVNKLTWSPDGKSLIAAVREQNKTTDTFYKINLKTNQKQKIQYKSDIPIDAKNLMLTNDEKTLYFTSDDYLYSLSL